jgi:HSP20 family protein
MRDEFDALFNRFFGDFPESFAGDWGLEDAGNEYRLRAEAPGFEPEDFDIQVSGNRLTIKGERKQDGKDKESFRSEQRFQETLTLPTGVNADQIEARYHSGVLELRLPKGPEAQAKRIAVKT